MVAWTAIAFKSIQRCLIRFSLRSSLGSLRTITELSLGYSSLRFCNLEQVLIKETFPILCSAVLQTRPFTFSVLLKKSSPSHDAPTSTGADDEQSPVFSRYYAQTIQYWFHLSIESCFLTVCKYFGCFICKLQVGFHLLFT